VRTNLATVIVRVHHLPEAAGHADLSAGVRPIGEIAAPQLGDADEHADAITAAIVGSVPVLSEDLSLSAEMYASSQAEVLRFLSLQVAHPGQPPPDIPPEALDLAGSMARRGVDLGVLSNSYRRGRNVARAAR
jgi:hypothetical protein